MITAADFEHMMKMRKAQEFRRQGFPPERALILAGVVPRPGLDGSRRFFTREEANLIFAKDDLARRMAEAEVARSHRARKTRKASLFFQVILAIILAIAVARIWKLV